MAAPVCFSFRSLKRCKTFSAPVPIAHPTNPGYSINSVVERRHPAPGSDAHGDEDGSLPVAARAESARRGSGARRKEGRAETAPRRARDRKTRDRARPWWIGMVCQRRALWHVREWRGPEPGETMSRALRHGDVVVRQCSDVNAHTGAEPDQFDGGRRGVVFDRTRGRLGVRWWETNAGDEAFAEGVLPTGEIPRPACGWAFRPGFPRAVFLADDPARSAPMPAASWTSGRGWGH
jgi:hypothetical protein